ncbi:MAG: type II toxin-antitoxin system RelB/DinJ family antitoxin [Candidatus Fimadaptatus sp.]
MANSTVNVTLRMDADLKRELESTLDAMGLNITTAVTMYAKAIVSRQQLPFTPTADPFFSSGNQSALRRSIASYEGAAASVAKSMAELRELEGDA